jgi:putative NADH-flavin reductase
VTTVALLGGTGRLGRFVLAGLLTRQLAVRMLVRSSNASSPRDSVAVIRGDVHNRDAIEAVISGSDMVLSALGSAGEPIADASSTAVTNLVPFMKARGLSRIVSVTGSAARLDSEIGSEHRWLAARRQMLMTRMAPLVLDGEAHMRLLADSALAWTVVRAPLMTTERHGVARLATSPPPPDATLGYAAVAQAIVEELLAPQWVGQAPFLRPAQYSEGDTK